MSETKRSNTAVRSGCRRISRAGSHRRFDGGRGSASRSASSRQLPGQLAHRQPGRPRDSRHLRVFHLSVTESFTLLDAGYAAARWGWYLTVFLVLGAANWTYYWYDPDGDLSIEDLARGAV